MQLAALCSLIMSLYTLRLTRRNRAATKAKWAKLARRFLPVTKNESHESPTLERLECGSAAGKKIRRQHD
jgi:hypothetical protein